MLDLAGLAEGGCCDITLDCFRDAQLLAAIQGNPDAMDAFASITAGTVSPVEFFNPVHIGQILDRAG